MRDRIERLLHRPVVAHALAAWNRYTRRLGPQFAAAVTYFSVLSLVPVLLFGIAMLGLTLTVLRPDWLALVRDAIVEQLGDGDLGAALQGFIDHVLFNWRSFTVFALVVAAYSGTKWVGHLKKAFRVMWLPRFADAGERRGFLREQVENVVIFLGLLLSVLIAFAITSGGGAFSGELIQLLGWQHFPGIGLLFRAVSILLSLVSSWLLFAFLFAVLPGRATTLRIWFSGTMIGAVAATLLQQVAGLLIGIFSRGRSATALGSVFGSVVVMMLMLNVLATIMLMAAAWVGTAETWPGWLADRDRARASAEAEAGEPDEVEVDDAPAPEDQSAAVPPGTGRARAARLRRERWAGRLTPEEILAQTPGTFPDATDAPPVSPEVAARGVRVGLGIGWGVGAATGLGLGAALAALVGRAGRR